MTMRSGIVADPIQPYSHTETALADLCAGLSRSWQWSAMAVQDIKLRYRGSVLGPFWVTLSTGIMVGAIGIIYARLFTVQTSHYLPFLAIGLLLWHFISTVITEGCQAFLSSRHIVHQVCMPLSVHAWRTVYRNLLVLLHCAVILPIVLIMSPPPLGWPVVTIIPALALMVINAFWITLLLGMVSARYRDVPPIAASAVRVVFFVTPVFWPSESLGDWEQLLPLNPFFAAIEVVRAPLLGREPLAYSWLALVLVTLLGCACTFVVFARCRPRIAYWL
jgi:ABC-2 type transport system permease protein/lipopolysaccharide transport system permease protein